ncbi:hypothetical protein G3I48_21975 [Streptomyces griseus]|uniref:hypothetical protein n=1 Tax=Streptomyces griseus TaxID=1911 RepID=UPI0013BBE7F9|nr:hypothetical protein [Streptomyces griseus]
MTARRNRPGRTGRTGRTGTESPPALDVPPFKLSLVRAVFKEVTSMHLSRPAAQAAASVTRTVLTEIIDGARRSAAREARKKLLPRDLLAALDRNVELEVGIGWYDHSPTFRGLTGGPYDADGAPVTSPERSRSRKPSALAGAHRFASGVRRILRSRGATATPVLLRDLDGIASTFLTDLARDATRAARGSAPTRFGTVTLVASGEPTPPPPLMDPPRPPSARGGDRRTIRKDDVLTAATFQLFGGNLRHQALTEAHRATETTSTA